MTDAKDFYTALTGDDERGQQLEDANAEPFDMASLGLHDKLIRSIPKDGPAYLPPVPVPGGDSFPVGGDWARARLTDSLLSANTVPMAGETPDTFEAGEPPRKPLPEMLAAEACIKLLSRETGFADWWSTLGGMGQAHYHDAMGDLIRARMVDFAEPAMSPGERADPEVEADLGTCAAIRQARNLAETFARSDTAAGHHPDVVKTREAKHALALLGYDGDTISELYEDIKRTAILGNAVSRELLRQDEADRRKAVDATRKFYSDRDGDEAHRKRWADKRAKIGERP